MIVSLIKSQSMIAGLNKENNMIRLQGKAFTDMRSKLRMIGYQVSTNGNIRAIMKYKTGYCRTRFSHWLNDEELERFKQSDFYKNNPPLTNEQLYKKRNYKH